MERLENSWRGISVKTVGDVHFCQLFSQKEKARHCLAFFNHAERRGWNRSHSERMESTAGGMESVEDGLESMRSIGWFPYGADFFLRKNRGRWACRRLASGRRSASHLTHPCIIALCARCWVRFLVRVTRTDFAQRAKTPSLVVRERAPSRLRGVCAPMRLRRWVRPTGRQQKKHTERCAFFVGDPYGNRTHVFSVRG